MHHGIKNLLQGHRKITGNAYKKLIRRKGIKEIPEECEKVTRKADY